MKKILFIVLSMYSFLFAVDNLVGKEYKELNINQDICPVKSVPIDKHKDWLGYIEFNDEEIVALSSPKYTFAYYLKELNHNKNESIKALYVTDFKTNKLIDAKTAYYVFGSNVMSVGGDDVIPFALESDAKEFFESKRGKQIYRFDRMTENFINYLDMR